MGKMREQYEQGDMITWAAVHNLVPLVGSVVAIALAWGSLSSRQEVMLQRVSYLETRVERLEGHQAGAGVPGLNIEYTPKAQAVQGVSTKSATILPTPSPTPRGIQPTKKL